MARQEQDLPAARPEAPAAGTFSCVIDTHPRFHLDALRWFASLTRLAGVEPADLVIHTVGPAKTEAGNGAVLIVPIGKALTPGVYTVRWHAVSVDTHHTQGNFQFMVSP